VIRRLIVAVVVVLGASTLLGGTAHAAQDVVCAYNHDPLHIGICVAL